MSEIPPIYHYSTFPYGGAAAAAISIHRSLVAQGIPSQFLYRRNEINTPLDGTFSEIEFQTPEVSERVLRDRLSLPKQWARRVEKNRVKKVIDQYKRHLEGNDRQTEVFSQAEEVQETFAPKYFEHSIVHLHWTAFGFDWPSFMASIPKDTPIIWTLHDQNAFTGGCHYSTGCNRFASGCGSCPQILQPAENDLSAHSFALKKRLLAGRNLHIVAPSLWMLQQAKRSPILQDAISFTHIRYGLDQNQFDNPESSSDSRGSRSPSLDSTSSKLAYQISTMKRNLLPTILLGAEDLSNKRKGIRYALEAINEIANRMPGSVRLWTFGKELPEEIVESLPENVVLHQWGYIHDRSFQGRLYRQADVFLLPSLEDNQPQMALEAMANQTPVVAFTIGGVPEVVRDGISGYCVPDRDTERMAKRTIEILTHQKTRDLLGRQAKLQVTTEHHWLEQGQAYLSLYRKSAKIQQLVA